MNKTSLKMEHNSCALTAQTDANKGIPGLTTSHSSIDQINMNKWIVGVDT